MTDQRTDAVPLSRNDEQAFLAGVIHYASTGDDISDLLTGASPRLFWSPDERRVFVAVAELHKNGEPIDSLTIAAYLRRTGQELDGGQAALSDIAMGDFASRDKLLAYRAELARLATERDTMEAVSDLLRHPTDTSRAAAIRRLQAITDRNAVGKPIEWWQKRYTMQTLRNADVGELAWRIHGILPIGLTLIFAEPKMAKSFAAQQIEDHLGAGKPLCGRIPAPEEVTRCLVIDFEGDRRQHFARSYMLNDRETDDNDEYGSIYIVPIDVLERECVDNSFESRLLWLERELAQAEADGDPYGYIRIDTAVDFMGATERGDNAYEVAKSRTTKLNLLAKRFDCAMVLIHHTNDSGDVNGSNAGWKGGVDAYWHLQRGDGPALGSPLQARAPEAAKVMYGIISANGRNLPGGFELSMAFTDYGWMITDEVLPAQIRRTGHAAALLTAWHEFGPQTVQGLKDHHALIKSIPDSALRSTVNRLRNAGAIKCDYAETGRRAALKGVSGRPPKVWYVVDDWGPDTAAQENPQVNRGFAPFAPPDTENGDEPGQKHSPRPTGVSRHSRRSTPKTAKTDGQENPQVNRGFAPFAPPEQGPGGSSPTASDEHPESPSLETEQNAVRRLTQSVTDRTSAHAYRRIPDDQRDQEPWSLKIYYKGHRWVADLSERDTDGKHVMMIDRRSAYPTAMLEVAVGAPELHHVGPLDPLTVDHFKGKGGRAGIYQVEWPEWKTLELGPPLGRWHGARDGLVWLTDPHMKLLADVDGQTPQVADSWLSSRSKWLFKDFANWARDQRAASRGDAERDEKVKEQISIAIRLIDSTKRSPMWRPDWLAAIHAEAHTRLWRAATRAHNQHGHVIALKATDEIHLLVDAGNDNDPPGFTLGSGFGKYGVKGIMSVDEWVSTKGGTRVGRTR